MNTMLRVIPQQTLQKTNPLCHTRFGHQLDAALFKPAHHNDFVATSVALQQGQLVRAEGLAEAYTVKYPQDAIGHLLRGVIHARLAQPAPYNTANLSTAREAFVKALQTAWLHQDRLNALITASNLVAVEHDIQKRHGNTYQAKIETDTIQSFASIDDALNRMFRYDRYPHDGLRQAVLAYLPKGEQTSAQDLLKTPFIKDAIAPNVPGYMGRSIDNPQVPSEVMATILYNQGVRYADTRFIALACLMSQDIEESLLKLPVEKRSVKQVIRGCSSTQFGNYYAQLSADAPTLLTKANTCCNQRFKCQAALASVY